MSDLIIKKRERHLGQSTCKTMALRFPKTPVEKLEEIARETGRFRNNIINIILEFGLAHCHSQK